MQPIRIYVARFGEGEGGLHFHILPRTESLTRKYLDEHPTHRGTISGPLLLDWARERGGDPLFEEEAAEVWKDLRRFFRDNT
jgi:hypothetical protein